MILSKVIAEIPYNLLTENSKFWQEGRATRPLIYCVKILSCATLEDNLAVLY